MWIDSDKSARSCFICESSDSVCDSPVNSVIEICCQNSPNLLSGLGTPWNLKMKLNSTFPLFGRRSRNENIENFLFVCFIDFLILFALRFFDLKMPRNGQLEQTARKSRQNVRDEVPMAVKMARRGTKSARSGGRVCLIFHNIQTNKSYL